MAKNTIKAKRYSQAIFEIALENDQLDTWHRDLEQLAKLAQDADYVSVMENPGFSIEKKKELLDAQIKDVSQMSRNLAHILISKGYFSLISEIFDQYQQLLDNYKGIAKAEVTTVVPLEDEDRQKIKKYLGEITGKEITLIEVVDPSIIGGIIARINGKIIDGSTRNQLTALKNKLSLSI